MRRSTRVATPVRIASILLTDPERIPNPCSTQSMIKKKQEIRSHASNSCFSNMHLTDTPTTQKNQNNRSVLFAKRQGTNSCTLFTTTGGTMKVIHSDQVQ